MPSCSASSTAAEVTSSMSIRLSASCCCKILSASRTGAFLIFVFLGKMPESISPMLISEPIPAISMPMPVLSSTSISTMVSSSRPLRSLYSSSCRLVIFSCFCSGVSSGELHTTMVNSSVDFNPSSSRMGPHTRVYFGKSSSFMAVSPLFCS